MSQQCTMKSRPLGKDEVLFLLDLISKQKVITSKATNASNNKLKEDAWKCIAQEFSAMAGEMRRPEQLRLKLENLKKAARKRSAMIRQNNLKTGGGKMYIPPDDTLDRVASMLGSTCSGFTVEFGGDGEQSMLIPKCVVDVPDLQPLPELSPVQEGASIVLVSGGVGGDDLEPACSGGGGDGNDLNFTPKQFIFNTPKNSFRKRRKLLDEVQAAQRDKELAMAAYFRARTEKVELENIKLRLEIEQLKNLQVVSDK